MKWRETMLTAHCGCLFSSSSCASVKNRISTIMHVVCVLHTLARPFTEHMLSATICNTSIYCFAPKQILGRRKKNVWIGAIQQTVFHSFVKWFYYSTFPLTLTLRSYIWNFHLYFKNRIDHFCKQAVEMEMFIEWRRIMKRDLNSA